MIARWNLNPVRLPISPPGHLTTTYNLNLAGPQGFEPRLPESKSGVLPLDEEPINLFC